MTKQEAIRIYQGLKTRMCEDGAKPNLTQRRALDELSLVLSGMLAEQGIVVAQGWAQEKI